MTPAKLIDLVASAFSLTPAELTSRSQQRHIAEARQAAAWVLRRAYPTIGLVEIGRLLGGRDHTTIGYSIAKIDERIAADPLLRAQLHSLVPQEQPALVRYRRNDHAMRWWVAQARDDYRVLAA